MAAQVPRSVMKPVTRRAGVTSKPGLAPGLPGAAISTVARPPSGRRPVIFRTSSDERSSIGMSRPDFSVQSMVEDGQRHIERHAIVVCGKRFEIGADLVRDIAVRRHAVGAHDAEIDLARLHVMAAGIVGDDGVLHAVTAELERGQRCTLIARTRLVHPHMQWDARIMRHIKRRQRRAPIDAGEPAGIAMREHIERLAVLLRGGFAQNLQAVLADGTAGLDVFVGDSGGFSPREPGALFARTIAQDDRACAPAPNGD